MPQDTQIVFTIQVRPDTVEVHGRIGADADEAEAFALCDRLIGAVRDFNRTESSRAEVHT